MTLTASGQTDAAIKNALRCFFADNEFATALADEKYHSLLGYNPVTFAPWSQTPVIMMSTCSNLLIFEI